MKLVYFASLRERIGKSEEECSPPDEVRSVADLIAWLSAQDEIYAAAFAHGTARAAIDKRHVKPEAPIAGASEIAFFPPMTGG
jgi:molybdopterin synthase sulfur carrier subunit